MTTAATTTGAGSLESLIKRDRLWVAAGVVGITALAWLYLVWMAAGIAGMDMGDAMLSAQSAPWRTTDFVLMFLMWAIMMVGSCGQS